MIAFVIQDNKSFTTICTDPKGNESKDLKTAYRNSIFVYSWYPLVINKYNKSDYFVYNSTTMNVKFCANESTPDSPCYIPEFIHQMKAKLLWRIDGVVRSTDNPLFGHLLLLNIDGTPKICFTPKTGNISEEVRHKNISNHLLINFLFLV